jgi:hypothetical protein
VVAAAFGADAIGRPDHQSRAIRALSDKKWFGSSGVAALQTTATCELVAVQAWLHSKAAKELLRVILASLFGWYQ